MFILNRILIIIFITIAFLITAGCTHYSKVPDYSLRNQPNVAIDNKINLSVAFFQNEEFQKAKWEIHVAGDTWLLEIGQQLANNSNELASILFKNVVTTDAATGKTNGQIDAFLTPRVVAIEKSLGAIRGDESITTIVLEWKLEDNQNNLIWIDTVKGEGRSTVPSYDEDVNTVLLDDLFRNSFQAMKSSPEIRKFADTLKKNDRLTNNAF